MHSKTEIPAGVLDASRTESTFPEASAATDATQVGALVPINPIPEPDSSEETVSSGTEEAYMAISTAPDVAQEQGKELESIAEAEYLPATDDEGSRQAQVTKPEKGAASANRRDRKKKNEPTLPREQVMDMAANEACRVAQSDFWPFGMQGPATETHAQFVYPHTDLGNAPHAAKADFRCQPPPRTGLSPSLKIDFVSAPLLGVWGCPYGWASPNPENPGNRVLVPKSVSSTRKMTIPGSKSAENRLNEAILSVNTAIFTQIYRYITHNNHYQQRSDYVDQEGYHGYVPGNDFRTQEAP